MLSRALSITLLAGLALCLLVVLPQAAAQSATSINEYPLPNGATSIDAMAIDSSGNIWMAQSSPAVLYEYVVSENLFKSHPIPTNTQAMIRGMSVYGNSYVWMADGGADQIIGYDIANNKFYNFTFPPPLQLDVSSVVSDGSNLWVGCNMELGQIGIYTDNLTDHYVDSYTADISDLAMDRQGNIWFVEANSGMVGGYYVGADKPLLFPIPTSASEPTFCALDSQGRLWFIESAVNQLGMFDTNLKTFKEIPMPVIDGKQVVAKQLAVDSDDNVWISDLANDRLIKYYPLKNVFVPVYLNGSKVYPNLIENDNDQIWFIESGKAALAEIQTDSLFGLTPTATPKPAASTNATAVPTGTATPTAKPTPKPSPGFGIGAGLVALAALLVIAKKASR